MAGDTVDSIHEIRAGVFHHMEFFPYMSTRFYSVAFL